MSKKSNTKVRIRYAETDQMGIVHHANYAIYLELARIDWLNKHGISYKEMEADGIILPVYAMEYVFKKSAFFDDEITIETSLRERPGSRIIFDFKIYNQNQDLLTLASVTLVFMNAVKKRPVACPEYLMKIIGY